MLFKIFFLIISFNAYGGEFLSHIDFAGKRVKLDVNEWGYYHPKELMRGKYKVLESLKSKGLLAFHSVETQIKDTKKTKIQDFKRKCLVKLPTIKQKRESSLVKINGKELCRQEFVRGGEVNLQFMLPSDIKKDFKTAYRMNILTFTFPEKSKYAKSVINSLLKELI